VGAENQERIVALPVSSSAGCALTLADHAEAADEPSISNFVDTIETKRAAQGCISLEWSTPTPDGAHANAPRARTSR
jgi:hypothetical protein